MIENRKGDLFAQNDVQALGQGVNCVGAMGAGIAVGFRKNWEDMYEDYRAACHHGELKPGGLHTWFDPEDELWIYNLASQNKPGPDASYEWLTSSMELMLEHMAENGVTSVALPQIGCGIGGLEWAKAKGIIEDLVLSHNAGSDNLVRVVLVEYVPA